MEGAYFQCCLLGRGIVGGQHKKAPSGPMGRCEEAQSPGARSQAEVPTGSPGLPTPTQRPSCPLPRGPAPGWVSPPDRAAEPHSSLVVAAEFSCTGGFVLSSYLQETARCHY